MAFVGSDDSKACTVVFVGVVTLGMGVDIACVQQINIALHVFINVRLVILIISTRVCVCVHWR